MYQSLLFELEAGIATLTLNRPERLNAYTVEMGEELVDAFARVRADPAVRVVILTGAGRAFCAGVDLEQLKAHHAARDVESAGAAQPAASPKGAQRAAGERSSADGERRPAGGERSTPRLGEEDCLRNLPLELLVFPKPVLVAINGAAIGVGVTLTLPCDVRLAADTAKLGLPFAKLGLLPGLGSTHLLPRLVGPGRALELVLTGRSVSAPEAAAIGLVNRVVPAAELLHEARSMATAMAACRPEVLAAAKAALLHGARVEMADAMRYEQEASALLRRG